VGLFTSPHLVDFRERIRVNGRKISRSYVMQWVSEYQKKDLGGLQPSFFELTSTMAFDYFAWRNVNVAVIETGLGGRLDSTNIVTPELSIITNIGLEHQQFLGNTLEEIASEKAGIIKHGQPVVIGRAEGVVRDVFEREAKRLYADIRFAQDRPEVLSAKHADGVLRIETVNYGHAVKAGENWFPLLAGKAGKKIVVKVRKAGKDEDLVEYVGAVRQYNNYDVIAEELHIEKTKVYQRQRKLFRRIEVSKMSKVI
jgi:folylpolyglutamate synthase/dihydrofolate synthase